MYISEFWCGVGATVLLEIAGLISYAIYFNNRRKDR